MKKEKKATTKTKEFASHPFGTLKGVRPAIAESPRPVGPVTAKPGLSLGEAELFLREVADVRRLDTHAPSGEGKQAPRPPARIAEEEAAYFLRALEDLRLDTTFRDDSYEEEQSVRTHPESRLRQVKQGTLRIAAQLDLHGQTRSEALLSLAGFIADACGRGEKAVLVITGKGNNSPGEPVLQGAVNDWLREAGKGMVVEVAPAPRFLGGSGALLVFLREKGP